MSAQASEVPGEPQTISVAGEAAVIPIGEYRRLKAIERHATAEEVAAAEAEEAQIEADIAAHRAYVAAGSPGAEDHEDVKRELLADFGL